MSQTERAFAGPAASTHPAAASAAMSFDFVAATPLSTNRSRDQRSLQGRAVNDAFLDNYQQLPVRKVDHRLSIISVPAKPRAAIVINITALNGMWVTKSIIYAPLKSRRRRKKNTLIASNVPYETVLRSAHE